MKFLDGEDLDAAIRRVLSCAGPRCAVAFWGRGASCLIAEGGRARLICNLGSGGTNPHEIEALLGAGHHVRQNDLLHAKVYIGNGQAVVASANLSANGLGLEAGEIAHWLEAGMVSDDIGSVVEWFEALWQNAGTRTIKQADLQRAKCLWKQRRSRKPSIPFADFDPDAEVIPLIDFFGSSNWKVNAVNVKAQTSFKGDEAEKAVGNSFDIAHPDDERWLTQGTWVLRWTCTSQGLPDKRAKLEWGRCGRIVREAFTYEGENKLRSMVLNEHAGEPEPFDCNDKVFSTAFRQVISEDRYSRLRSSDEEEAFFTPERIKLMRNFWCNLKNVFCHTGSWSITAKR